MPNPGDRAQDQVHRRSKIPAFVQTGFPVSRTLERLVGGFPRVCLDYYYYYYPAIIDTQGKRRVAFVFGMSLDHCSHHIHIHNLMRLGLRSR